MIQYLMKLTLFPVTLHERPQSSLDLWDLIVFVLGNTTQIPDRSRQPVVNADKDHGSNKRSQGKINALNSIDCVPQTSNFRIKKLICMCLKTTKQ